jgi:hypothetical protein
MYNSRTLKSSEIIRLLYEVYMSYREQYMCTKCLVINVVMKLRLKVVFILIIFNYVCGLKRNDKMASVDDRAV